MRFRKQLVLIPLAFAAIGICGKSSEAQSRSPWQQHRGQEVGPFAPPNDDLVQFGTTISPHGAIPMYAFSAPIAPGNDPGWGPAPNPDTIGFSITSRLCGFIGCQQGADFTYFQTFVDIPVNFIVTSFTIGFSGMDDGARTTIFNSAHPTGDIVPGSYVFLGGSGTADLSSLVLSGEVNRVVITQIDDCCVGNNLQRADVVINGTIIHNNAPPVCDAGGPYASSCASAVAITASASDADGDDLQYSWSSSNPAVTVSPANGVILGGVGAIPLPASTASLIGLPCGVPSTLTLTVSDGAATSTCTTSVTFNDTVNPTFDLPVPDSTTVACTTALPAPPTVTASDNCDTNVAITFIESALVGTQCNGTITRTWTATDDCGNVATHVQTITVRDDVDPTIDGVPGAVTVECDAVPAPAEPTASDNCDAAPTLDYDQARTDGNCEDNYTLTRTWTATDACGNVTVETQVITVQDTTAPTAIAVLSPVMPLPANSAASACSPASRGEFRIVCEGSDNCDDMPVLSAKLRSAQSVVGPNSTCVTVVTEVDVACDQVVVIELQAAPCPGAGPTSARPATSVDSTGVLTVYGEHVLLEVTATDRCGNSGTDIFDPSADCEVGGGDLCCPAVARPASNCTNPCAVPFDESPTTRAATSPGAESSDLPESSDAGRRQP